MNLKHLAITLHVDEATDASEFQQRARVLQSLRQRGETLQVGTRRNQVRHPLPRLHLPCWQGQDNRGVEGHGQAEMHV
jgi:hypothetical protein